MKKEVTTATAMAMAGTQNRLMLVFGSVVYLVMLGMIIKKLLS